MIDCILRLHGKKRFYEISQSARGNMYEFDNKFIQALDTFFMGEVQDMTKSQYNNIELFVKFADGEIDSSHEDYEALVECDKYLATIGVE